MPTRKRKSEGVAVADDVDATPAKRARKPSSGSAESQPEEAVSQPTTPGTEKKGRGRPRKYPPAPPKDPNEPKRGRGRPRKFPLPDGQTAPTPKEKKYPGRGRPRKSIQAQNGDEAGGGSAAEEANQAETDINVDSDASGRSYWLMKAEPESRFEKGVDVKFSIDDLRNATEPEAWDGVRNPVARNLMRNMKKGDHAFFYHSNCKTPGIVGLMEIVREHSVDESAFDPKHPYYDEKSSRDKPKWDVVHVEFRRKFEATISLNELKSHAQSGGPLEDLQTLKQSRLSVSAVTPKQWEFIMGLVEAGDKKK